MIIYKQCPIYPVATVRLVHSPNPFSMSYQLQASWPMYSIVSEIAKAELSELNSSSTVVCDYTIIKLILMLVAILLNEIGMEQCTYMCDVCVWIFGRELHGMVEGSWLVHYFKRELL